MADTLIAGDDEFEQNDGSLAGQIEQGIDDALAQFGLPGLTAENRADRTPFILGIAKGVVSFLLANEEAFKIRENGDGGHSHSGHVEIDGTA